MNLDWSDPTVRTCITEKEDEYQVSIDKKSGNAWFSVQKGTGTISGHGHERRIHKPSSHSIRDVYL